MKNFNKRIGLVIGLACVVLCVLFLLTMCNGGDRTDSPEEVVQATETVPVTEPADTTEVTEAPTEEPTEESTEPTEETEPEEEEETTPTTPSGSTTPGGTGGFTGSTTPDLGGDDEDEENNGPTVEVLEVPAAGTATNAYTEYLGLGDELQTNVGSVMVPAGGTVYYHFYNADGQVLTIADENAYVVYNEVTYEADEYGLVLVELTAVDEVTPVAIQLGNKGEAEELYNMEFAPPLGSVQNPEVIAELAPVYVALGADRVEGYYLSWTSPYDCTLDLNVQSVTPVDALYELTATVGENTVTMTEGKASIDVLTDEEVLICVVPKTQGVDMEIILVPSVSGEAGSATNPCVEDMEGRDSFDTMAIPAGGNVYYQVLNAQGMTLTVENPNAYVIYDSMTYGADANGIVSLRLPMGEEGTSVDLIFGNLSQEELSYTVSFAYPQGGSDEPEILESLGVVCATVSSDYEGHYYSWTADDSGVLSVGVLSMTNLADSSASVDYEILIHNVTKDSVMTMSADGWMSGAEYPIVSNLVEAGDEVQIAVVVNGDAGSVAAQAELSIDLSGSEELQFSMSSDYVKIPAASWYEVHACIRIGEQILTIENAQDLTLVVNDTEYTANANGVITLVTPEADPRNPVNMRFITTAESAKNYTLSFVYPLGHLENPGQLLVGANQVNVPEGSDDGYYLTWTAPDTGVLTVQVAEADVNLANVGITNMTTYDTVNLWDSGLVNPLTMEVSAGQEIRLNVTAKSTLYPAITVNLVASYETAYGSKSNPVILADGENTVAVGAGETIYCSTDATGLMAVISGADLSVIYNDETVAAVEGLVSLELTDSGIFGITNNGAAEGEYTITFTYPIGHEQNPEAVDTVDYLIPVIAAGKNGHYYSWTADNTGVLTALVLETEYQGVDVVINNMTTGNVFALSTDGWINGFEYPAVSNLITEGDELLIGILTTVSDADREIAVTFSVSGQEELMMYMSANTVAIPVASSHTVYAYTRAGEQQLVIENAADLSVTMRGTTYTADESGIISLITPETDMNNPLEMTLVSTSETAKTYILNFTYQPGHLENPVALTMGNVAVNVPAGAEDGFYYTWTAPSAGQLAIAVEETALMNVTLIHQTTYESVTLWGQDPDTGKIVASSPVVMDVAAGDVVYVNIASRSSSYPEVNSSVEASFTSTATEAPVALMALEEEHPLGSFENPSEIRVIRWMEDMKVAIEEETDGYWYSWTARRNGTLNFSIDRDEWDELMVEADEDVRINITLINTRTKEEVQLWNYDHKEKEWIESEEISLYVRKGDEVLIRVTATVPVDTFEPETEENPISCLKAEVTISGTFVREEEQPQQVVEEEAPIQEQPAVEEVPVVEDIPVAEETVPSEPAQEPVTAVDEIPQTEPVTAETAEPSAE